MSPLPKPFLSSSPGRLCPTCRTKTGRPIVRGLPSPEVFRALEAGVIDVELGGCCVGPDDPTHRCRTCGQRFGGRKRVPRTPAPDDGPGA